MPVGACVHQARLRAAPIFSHAVSNSLQLWHCYFVFSFIQELHKCTMQKQTSNWVDYQSLSDLSRRQRRHCQFRSQSVRSVCLEPRAWTGWTREWGQTLDPRTGHFGGKSLTSKSDQQIYVPVNHYLCNDG